jgi:hypothetical protein
MADIATAEKDAGWRFGVIHRDQPRGKDDGSPSFCSCRGSRLLGLQPTCVGGRRGSLVRRDQRQPGAP